MKINLKATRIFEQNYEEYQIKKNRILINEGGTGSSKTYSLAQLFSIILMNGKNERLTIARKTMPALKATAMFDFFSVLKGMNAYRDSWYNKTEHLYEYRPTGSAIDFISLGETKEENLKVRSRRRNHLWINEANELSADDFKQLAMRTDGQIFLDYNPSHQTHWIYDQLQIRKDCLVIHSTYKDNPFLPRGIVKEIEGYQNVDENYWRIYGLGFKGIFQNGVYTHWQLIDELPEGGEKIFGLDYGYNHPTALVDVRIKDGAVYVDEKIYQRFLNNAERIKLMQDLVVTGELSKNDYVYADNQPEYIKEMQDAGFNVIPADKEQGSVKSGIDEIKKRPLWITKHSVNAIREAKGYAWKTKGGSMIDEPVKIKDDIMDAIRYAVYSYLKQVKLSLEWV